MAGRKASLFAADGDDKAVDFRSFPSLEIGRGNIRPLLSAVLSISLSI